MWDLIRPFQMTSDNFITKQRFKFIYLDGGHSKKQVVRDIAHFGNLYDTFMAGDDYNGGGGVREAVNEMLKTYQLVGDPKYPSWLVQNNFKNKKN